MIAPNSPEYKFWHDRIARRRGKPQHCVVCGTTDPSVWYEWANVTGDYSDIYGGYKRMCRSCHFKHDGLHKNFGSRMIQRGENNNNARLTALQVSEIRDRHARCGTSADHLAYEFKVTPTHIRDILRRNRWK